MIHRFAIILACLFVGACASAEGPGSSLETISPGVQQAQPVQTAPRPTAVASQPLATPGAQSVAQAPAGTGPALQPGTLSLPQSTGLEPAPTLQDFSRIDPRQVPGSDPFAGQRPAEQTLSSPTTTQQQTLQSAVQTGLAQPNVAPALVPATPQWPRVSLAPISTAPEPHATQLFDAIDDATYRRGMQFVFFGDETAQYVVRSQVSAIPGNGNTSVIYVFDVFDARGTLRHRVSGSQSIARSGVDGWAFVDPTTKQVIADDVAGRLLNWLRQNPA